MAIFDVLMPVKNGERYLASAVASIQAQTITDWRLLVLDHGSTDRTCDMVSSMAIKDPRIVLCSFPTAQGLSGLLNKGLSLIEAPYTMRMDADDECFPERMALTLEAFARNPEVILVGGQSQVIDSEGKPLSSLPHPCDRDELARCVLFRNTFVHPSITLRSQEVADNGIRYGHSMFREKYADADIEVPNLAEDYLLFGEIALQRRAINLPQKILRYRFHAGSVSRLRLKEQLMVSAAISRHLSGLLGRWHGHTAFDPVPFCTHGQNLMEVGDRSIYEYEYNQMIKSLHDSGPSWSSEEGRRKLSWLKVFVNHNPASLAVKTLKYKISGRGKGEVWDSRSIVNAIQQRLRGREPICINPINR